MPNKQNNHEAVLYDLNVALNRMIGAKCLNAELIPPIKANSIRLHFGNSLATEQGELSEYRDYSIEIWCLWRVRLADHVLGAHIGGKGKTEEVHELSNQLLGKQIQAVEIIQPSFDLHIQFTEHIFLSIFCGGLGLNMTNYVFHDLVGRLKWQKPLGYVIRENGSLDYRPDFPEE